MTTRTLIVLLAGVLLVMVIISITVTPMFESLADPAWEPIPTRTASTVLDPSQGTVLDSAQAGKLLNPCSRPGPWAVHSFWQPDSNHVRQLEQDLAILFDGVTVPWFDPEEAHHPPLSSYYRQYVGLVGFKGDRYIYVNGFLRLGTVDREHDWKALPVMMCDGGAAYFGVEYLPEGRQFRRFVFDGGA